MEKFHNLKYKKYLHDRLNTSKGVIKSRELSLVTPVETKTTLEKQRVMNYERVTIRRDGEEIQTLTYIFTIHKLTTHKEVKIGYYFKREQYIPTTLRCFKYHKYRYDRESCRGSLTCGRHSQREVNHMEEDYPSKTKCSNC